MLCMKKELTSCGSETDASNQKGFFVFLNQVNCRNCYFFLQERKDKESMPFEKQAQCALKIHLQGKLGSDLLPCVFSL